MDGYAGRFLVLVVKIDKGGESGFDFFLIFLDDFAAFFGVGLEVGGVGGGVKLGFGAVFILGGEADGDESLGNGVTVGAFFAELFGQIGGGKGFGGLDEDKVGFGLEVGETGFF